MPSIMLLCRTAAALDLAFKSPGSSLLRAKASKLKDVTLTLRTDHSFQRHRFSCASVRRVYLPSVHLGKQHPELIQNWDTSSTFVTSTDWAHLDWVAAVAVRRESAEYTIFRQPLVFTHRRPNSRGDPAGNVLFTGNWDVSSRRCSTRTMQTRSSSTQAATKKNEEQTDDDKGVISTFNTSTAQFRDQPVSTPSGPLSPTSNRFKACL